MIDTAVALTFVFAFLVGVRSTWRLWRRYQATSPTLTEPRAYLVLVAFVAVSLIVTAAAGYFGFVSVRRLLGFEPIPGTPFVSTIVAICVLFIPALLDAVVKRVADGASR